VSAGIPKGHRWPSREERAARDAKVRQMRADGASYRAIGEALGITGPFVYKIARRLDRADSKV
jgi:DNA invertase Pin-like site-specific DNA recombinase